MPLNKLRGYLDSHNIRYLIFSHSLAYTAQGIAALTHISGKDIAKTVIVRIDGNLAMAVVPASRHVDLPLLRRAVGAQTVEGQVPRLRGRGHAAVRKPLRDGRLCGRKLDLN